ncbi:MAG: MBL fold metallo-hydrolase [Candidatus Hermodarchaeota archaeon]
MKLNPKEPKIILLGTGNPNPDPMRFGPALAILVNNSSYLVDFGVGITRQTYLAYSNFRIKSLETSQLTKGFLTHLHSDHTLGYPDLILTPWIMGRSKPLEIYGPLGTQEMTDYILKAYHLDIKERLEGLEPANETGYNVKVSEIQSNFIYEDENITVEAFPVNHGTLTSYGFKFITPKKIITISGDTAPFDECFDYYKGCNILIHEVYSSNGLEKLPPNWKRYHSNVHTSSNELANIASKVKPDLLILYHQLFWGASEKELLAEVKKKYYGKVVSGKDLQIF